MSESNYRFERGVDPVGVNQASLRACQMILELAGGQLAEGVIDVWAEPFHAPVVALRPRRCSSLLGMDVPPQRQADVLQRLGLSARMDGEKIVCTIPPHRGDLRQEADLIEEVARLEGYQKIPVRSQICHGVTGQEQAQRTRRQIGAAMSAVGFDEAITVSFIDRQEAALFGHDRTVDVDTLARRTNNTLRPTLLPSLLRVCKTNQDTGNAAVSVYELAAVFPPAPRGATPHEYVELAMAATAELPDLRGALETVAQRINPQAALTLRPCPLPGLERDTGAEVLLDGKSAGTIGQVSPEVLDHYGIERQVAAAAVRLDALATDAGKTRIYTPMPRYPAVSRDLSLIVDEHVTWDQLSHAILAVDQPMRQALDYVTTYRGTQTGPGRKSVTVTLVYRSPDATLRSEEVDELIRHVVEAARNKLAAEIRA